MPTEPMDAIHPDVNLPETLLQLWRSGRRGKALKLAEESGRAHDAEVLRNRERAIEERNHGRA